MEAGDRFPPWAASPAEAIRIAGIARQTAAAQIAAARAGVELTPRTAEQIALAVLECADDEFRVIVQVAPSVAEDPEAIRMARERARRQLAWGLAENELLPVALPREVIGRPPVPWGMTEMHLAVPVRHPNR